MILSCFSGCKSAFANHHRYIDDSGYFSSLEQVKDRKDTASNATNTTERPPARISGSFDATKQEAEANMLAKVFHKARQIIFLPLWDSAGGRSNSDVIATA